MNHEGYSDRTAEMAMARKKRDEKEDQEEKRFRKMMAGIFNICDLAGFHIEGRVTFVDTKTGRVWR